MSSHLSSFAARFVAHVVGPAAVLSFDGSIQAANPAAEALLPAGRDTAALAAWADPRDLAEALGLAERLRSEGAGARGEMLLRTRDGSRHLALSACVDEEAAAFYVLAEDRTAAERMREDLARDMELQLERARQSLRGELVRYEPPATALVRVTRVRTRRNRSN